jgi:hypothetical protein
MVKRRANTTATKDIDWDKLVKEYEDGATQQQLAEKYNLVQGTVGYQLGKRTKLRASANDKKAVVANFDWASISKENESGSSCAKLAKQFGVTVPTIVRGIRDFRDGDISYNPYRPVPINTVNEHVFDVLTEEAAYWIGMLITDGTIFYPKDSNPQVILELQEQDKGHLEKYLKFLGANFSLTCTVKKDRKYYKVKFASKHITQKLEEYGITQRKTFTAKAAACLLDSKHFWRGVIDGDGTISKTGYRFSVVSASEVFLQQFIDFLEKTYPGVHISEWDNNNDGSPARCAGVGRLTPGKMILEELYGNSTVYLDRKYSRVFPG